jgi:hypothetical protein
VTLSLKKIYFSFQNILDKSWSSKIANEHTYTVFIQHVEKISKKYLKTHFGTQNRRILESN